MEERKGIELFFLIGLEKNRVFIHLIIPSPVHFASQNEIDLSGESQSTSFLPMVYLRHMKHANDNLVVEFLGLQAFLLLHLKQVISRCLIFSSVTCTFYFVSSF